MGRSRAELLQGVHLWGVCGKLPGAPEADPVRGGQGCPSSAALPAGTRHCQPALRWHGCSLSAASLLPRDTRGRLQQGMFVLFPFQVSLFSSSLSTAQIHIFSANKRKMLAVTRAAERMGGFFFGIDGLFCHQGYLWSQRGGVAWAASPRERKAGAEPGETLWAWFTPGNCKAPRGSREPQSCWVTRCAVPPGLGPLQQPLAAAGGEARPQLELLLQQPSTAASPGPAPEPCTRTPLLPSTHLPRAGGSPSLSRGRRECGKRHWQNSIALGAESCGFVLRAQLLHPCLSFPPCEGWQVTPTSSKGLAG